MSQYVIRGGREGYERLQLLARARRGDTLALLEHVGVPNGARCLDLGCGGGEVTFELARLAGPGGHVVGVDMDEIKLDLARAAPRRSGASPTSSSVPATSTNGATPLPTTWSTAGSCSST